MYLENIAHVEELVINYVFKVAGDILSITHSFNEFTYYWTIILKSKNCPVVLYLSKPKALSF